MAIIGPRMDPESAKRLASGFWKRDYDMESCITKWTCDKRGLHDSMAKAMLNREFTRCLHEQGTKLLDKLWGKGTEEAYRYKSPNDRVCLAIRDDERQDMAYFYNTGTTATTSGTSATTNTMFTRMPAVVRNTTQEEMTNNLIMQNHRPQAPLVPRKPVSKALPRDEYLNVPFNRKPKLTLLEQLQRDFNRWAGDCVVAQL